MRDAPEIVKAADAGDDAKVRALLHAAPEAVHAFHPSFGTTALNAAAKRGYGVVVATLLAAGASVTRPADFPDYPGWRSPLLSAVEGGHVDVARTLLAAGANPLWAHNYSGTALHVAAGANQAAIVALLVDECGMAVDLPDPDFCHDTVTPLSRAAKEGAAEATAALLARGAQPGFVKEWPLRHPAVLAQLLAAGADPQQIVGLLAANPTGVSPNPAVMELLANAGVDLARACGSGGVPLLLQLQAQVAQQPELRAALLDASGGPQVTKLHRALVGADLAAALPLASDAAAASALDAAGRGPLLLLAARRSQAFRAAQGLPEHVHPTIAAGEAQLMATAQALLAAGADPNARDVLGWTPLMAAVMAGNAPLAALLVKHGASVDVVDAAGYSLLHRAARTQCLDFLLSQVPALCGAGVDVNAPAPGDHGQTPLLMAVEQNREHAVRRLLELGANPGTANAAGQTPLHVAAANWYGEVAKALLEAGAPVDARRPNDQRTALHITCASGHTADCTDIAQLLLDAGADKAKTDANVRIASKFLLLLLL